MPKPYSADLRERVLLAEAAGLSPAVVAARFGVGLSTVYLWRQQARAEGRRCAKAHGGGRGRLTRRARRSCGGWWPSATIALWTNIASCWRPAPGGGGSADRPCAVLCGGSSCGAKKDTARQRAGSGRYRRGAGGLLRAGPAA